MALRDYMQDLLHAQMCVEDECSKSEPVKVIIVDDNSFSFVPDECNEDLGNRSMCDLSYSNGSSGTLNCSEIVDGDHGYLRVEWPREPRDESNRIMLDGCRRRQRFLRDTLSPSRSIPRNITASPLRTSPTPIITQWTPIDRENDSQRPITRDSQRGRMARLKTSLRMQQSSSPPLL